ICNSRLVDNERALVEEFAGMLNTRLIYFLPRDNMVQRAECNRQTVIEFAPDSNQAGEYRRLAQVIDTNTQFSVPTPISAEELEKLLQKYTIL
ncbi:MAG: nitrogenase reductase, partial [Faecousia sp.]